MTDEERVRIASGPMRGRTGSVSHRSKYRGLIGVRLDGCTGTIAFHQDQLIRVNEVKEKASLSK